MRERDWLIMSGLTGIIIIIIIIIIIRRVARRPYCRSNHSPSCPVLSYRMYVLVSYTPRSFIEYTQIQIFRLLSVTGRFVCAQNNITVVIVVTVIIIFNVA